MRIGMRLLLGYFLIVAVAAWFVLSIFVQEIKPVSAGQPKAL